MTIVPDIIPASLTQKLAISSATIVTIPLINTFKLATTSPFWSKEECFGEYTLCNQTACKLETEYASVLSISNANNMATGTLSINLKNSTAPLNAYVGIMQPDRSYLKIPIFIEVCGYETLIPVNEQLNITKTNLTSATQDFVIDLSILFNNSSPNNSCPITNYSLKQQNGSQSDISPEIQSFVKINSTKLTIQYEVPYLIFFSVMAETQNKKYSWVTFIINLTTPPLPPPPPPKVIVNQPPTIEGLPTELEIILEDSPKDPVFKFTSSKAKDKENDKITLSFTSDLIQKSFFKVSQNSDDSFTIEIDKSLLTSKSAGSFPLKIEAGDSKALMKSSYTISITIKDPKSESASSEKQTAAVTEPEKPLQQDAITEGDVATKELTAQEKDALNKEKKRKEDEAKTNMRLSAKGFQRNGNMGFTFPGVDPNQVDSALKNQKSNKEEEVEIIPDPKMSIGPISAKGELIIDFNQDMIAPSVINQRVYQSVFTFAIKSDIDNSLTYGRFKIQNKNKTRTLEEENDENEEKPEIEELGFFIEVTKHDARQIKIQLNFTTPSAISAGSNKDQMIIKVLELSLFKSSKTLKILERKSFENGGDTISKAVPPIISEESAQSISSTTDTGGTIMSLLSTGNFAIGILLGGSMQQLWGMIRAMQMIVLCALVRVPTPAHTFMFFSGCMMLAQMDVLDGQGWYSKWFVFKETHPLNQNFELFGIPDKNFIMNSGSFFIILFLLIIFNFFKFLINKIAVQFAKYRFARRIGIWIYSPSYQIQFQNEALKLFLESYFDLVMCALLNMYSFFQKNNGQSQFIEFFATSDDVMCSLITIVLTICLISFPIVGYRVITKNLSQLNQKNIYTKYRVFYNDNLTNTKNRALYNIYFMIRRFLSVMVLVYLDNLPFFQCTLLMMFSTINLAYMISAHPLKNKKENRIDIFNEFCIGLSCHIMTTFLNIAMPLSLKDELGWFLMAVAGINIFVNLILTMLFSIKGIIFNFKQKNYVKKAQKAFQQMIDNRQKLIKQFPNRFKNFEEELEVQEIVKQTKDWYAQQRWLIANKVNFSKFDDEKRFQQQDKQLNLIKRANSVKLSRAIDNIAKNNTQKIIEQMILQKKLKEQQKLDDIKKEKWLKNNQLIAPLKTAIQQQIQSQIKIRINQKNPNLMSFLRINPKMNKQLKKQSTSQMTQIIENTAENDEEIDSQQCDITENKDNLQKSVYQQEYQKLQNSSLLQNFNFNSKFFDSNAVQDLKNLQKISKNFIAIQPILNQEKLQEIYLQEKKNYKESNYKYEEAKVHNEVFQNALSLDFLINKSSDDEEQYHQQIQQMFKKNQSTLLTEHEQNTGIRPMKNGGQNNYIQSILQCFMEIGDLAKYFIAQKYLEIDANRNKPICETLRQVYIDNFQNLIAEIQNTKQSINISYVQTAIESSFKINQAYSAEQFLVYLLDSINKEINLDPLGKQPNDVSLLVKQTFEFTLCSAKQCKNSHGITKYNSQTILYLDFNQSVEESIFQFFKKINIRVKCKHCNEQQGGNKFINIVKLPQIFILVFPIFNENQENISKNMSIPLTYDMGNHLLVSEIKDDIQSKYELFGIVNCIGDTLSSSCYQSIVQRKFKQKNKPYWVQFSQSKRKVKKQDIVLSTSNPHILFYRLIPSHTV